jgi:hypothetical protein
MIYQAGVATSLVAWLLNDTGALPRLLPHVTIFGVDVGFYVLHGALFLVISAIILFLRRNERVGMSEWVSAASSRKGAATTLDLLVLVTAILIAIGAVGTNHLSPYLIGLLFFAFAGAMESLLTAPPTNQAASPVLISLAEEDETPLAQGSKP